MEQFEKWWKEHYNEPRYIDNSIRYSAAKVGWKHALKFALTIASAWRKCGIPTEVEDAINKELGE